MRHRPERVADVMRRELAELLLRRVHDPRIRGCSIVGIRVSPDLRHARVRVSTLGSEAERQEALDALHHASGFLRSEMARRMRHFRRVPELVFELDRGAEYSVEISELLEALHDDHNGT